MPAYWLDIFPKGRKLPFAGQNFIYIPKLPIPEYMSMKISHVQYLVLKVKALVRRPENERL